MTTWLLIYIIIMLVLNLKNIKLLFDKKDYLERYNRGMDQMEILNYLFGNKLVVIAMIIFGFLYVTFYVLFYIIVGSMFPNNLFLLIVSFILLIKSALGFYGTIAIVKQDPTKIDRLPKYEYINYISEPVELIYIIVFTYLLMS